MKEKDYSLTTICSKFLPICNCSYFQVNTYSLSIVVPDSWTLCPVFLMLFSGKVLLRHTKIAISYCKFSETFVISED